MANRGVVIRYRGNEVNCADCIRITVGTNEENKALMALLRTVLSELSAS
jgi:histidinol-phosphate aminotransferase